MTKSKKFFLMGMAIVLLLLPTLAVSGKGKDPVPSKEKNIFVLKTERKFIGGTVQVWNDGELVSSLVLDRKKVLIDFGDVKKGLYTIRLLKDSKVEEFHYEKK